MSDERPPQAVVMQLVMGAWASQAVSAITRLGASPTSSNDTAR